MVDSEGRTPEQNGAQFFDLKLEKGQEPVRLVVRWETDEEADPESRYIAAIDELATVVTGPTVRLTENRLEMVIREQLALARGSGGMFARWIDQMKNRKGGGNAPVSG